MVGAELGDGQTSQEDALSDSALQRWAGSSNIGRNLLGAGGGHCNWVDLKCGKRAAMKTCIVHKDCKSGACAATGRKGKSGIIESKHCGHGSNIGSAQAGKPNGHCVCRPKGGLPDGQGCWFASDCASKHCNWVDLKCGKRTAMKTCVVHKDCASGACAAVNKLGVKLATNICGHGAYVGTAWAGKPNGYCVCKPKGGLTDGQKCWFSADCASKHCNWVDLKCGKRKEYDTCVAHGDCKSNICASTSPAGSVAVPTLTLTRGFQFMKNCGKGSLVGSGQAGNPNGHCVCRPKAGFPEGKPAFSWGGNRTFICTSLNLLISLYVQIAPRTV